MSHWVQIYFGLVSFHFHCYGLSAIQLKNLLSHSKVRPTHWSLTLHKGITDLVVKCYNVNYIATCCYCYSTECESVWGVQFVGCCVFIPAFPFCHVCTMMWWVCPWQEGKGGKLHRLTPLQRVSPHSVSPGLLAVTPGRATASFWFYTGNMAVLKIQDQVTLCIWVSEQCNSSVSLFGKTDQR